MAGLNSFDITSTIDLQEVDNAVNQARKELGQRYAFKVESVWDVLQTRLVRRNVAVKNMKRGDVETASGGTVKQVITLQQGIPTDAAREIVKHLKDLKLKKVTA